MRKKVAIKDIGTRNLLSQHKTTIQATVTVMLIFSDYVTQTRSQEIFKDG